MCGQGHNALMHCPHPIKSSSMTLRIRPSTIIIKKEGLGGRGHMYTLLDGNWFYIVCVVVVGEGEGEGILLCEKKGTIVWICEISQVQ